MSVSVPDRSKSSINLFKSSNRPLLCPAVFFRKIIQCRYIRVLASIPISGGFQNWSRSWQMFSSALCLPKKSDGERLVIVSVSSYSKSHRGCLVSQIFLRKIIQCRYISICGKRYPCLLCSLPSQKTIASAHGCFSLFCSKPVLYLFNVLEFISKITQYLNTRFCGSRYPYFWQSQRRAAGNCVCFCPLGLLKNHDNTP